MQGVGAPPFSKAIRCWGGTSQPAPPGLPLAEGNVAIMNSGLKLFNKGLGGGRGGGAVCPCPIPPPPQLCFHPAMFQSQHCHCLLTLEIPFHGMGWGERQDLVPPPHPTV